jgi:hypothetical protein
MLSGSSYNGGDKDPPKKNIEKTHTVYTSSKRKKEIHRKQG